MYDIAIPVTYSLAHTRQRLRRALRPNHAAAKRECLVLHIPAPGSLRFDRLGSDRDSCAQAFRMDRRGLRTAPEARGSARRFAGALSVHFPSRGGGSDPLMSIDSAFLERGLNRGFRLPATTFVIRSTAAHG